MTTRTDDPRTDEPSTVRRAVVMAVLFAVAAAVVVALAGAGTTILSAGPGGLLPDLGHGGEQLEEPDVEAVDDGLVEATRQLHGHLNWLIWGPDDAEFSPDFATLADNAILLARDEGEAEVATLLVQTRDGAVRDQDLQRAHDLVAEAQRIASGEDPNDRLYEPEPEPDLPDAGQG